MVQDTVNSGTVLFQMTGMHVQSMTVQQVTASGPAPDSQLIAFLLRSSSSISTLPWNEAWSRGGYRGLSTGRPNPSAQEIGHHGYRRHGSSAYPSGCRRAPDCSPGTVTVPDPDADEPTHAAYPTSPLLQAIPGLQPGATRISRRLPEQRGIYFFPDRAIFEHFYKYDDEGSGIDPGKPISVYSLASFSRDDLSISSYPASTLSLRRILDAQRLPLFPFACLRETLATAPNDTTNAWKALYRCFRPLANPRRRKRCHVFSFVEAKRLASSTTQKERIRYGHGDFAFSETKLINSSFPLNGTGYVSSYARAKATQPGIHAITRGIGYSPRHWPGASDCPRLYRQYMVSVFRNLQNIALARYAKTQYLRNLSTAVASRVVLYQRPSHCLAVADSMNNSDVSGFQYLTEDEMFDYQDYLGGELLSKISSCSHLRFENCMLTKAA
ncbi:hypothetical protein MW887_002478 [Aspergillus wentii]|nr:hypothetical protein MW887_002478 [Aspergillus wentii]